MNNHPKVPFQVSKWMHIINGISILCIAGSIIYVIFLYPTLPETIPVHFNAKGEADNWGSKMSVFIMPIIGLLLFVGMYFLSKYPHVYNYPFTITEENDPRIYAIASAFMTIINLEMVLIFTFASIDIMGDFLGVWFVAVVLGVPLLTIALFVYRLNSLK